MQLQDFCQAIVDCEHKTAPTTIEGYPSIRTPNIGPGYFILDGVNRVSRETYVAWTRRLRPLPGDLIMAREAPVGNVAMIPEGMEPCLGQRTLLIRPNQSVLDSRYLVYLLISPVIQGQIHGKTNGATVAHLNMSDVRQLELPAIPDLLQQRRIASILSAYDDLIENHRKRIAILEDMARRLYREWFVHFRYPGHESVPLVDSPLGRIPQGWTPGSLGTIADEIRVGVAKGKLSASTPHVGLEHIPRRQIPLDAWDLSDELGSNKLVFAADDLLFAKIRPYFHKASVAPVDGVCSADTIVIRAKQVDYLAMTWAIASSDELVAVASATANGAKMPRTDWPTLSAHPAIIPDSGILARFSDCFISWVRLQQNLVAQISVLRRTRDLLLPRLMSGTLSVEALATAEATVP